MLGIGFVSSKADVSYAIPNTNWCPLTFALTVQSYGDYLQTNNNVPAVDANGAYRYSSTYSERWLDKPTKIGNKELIGILIQKGVLTGDLNPANWVLYAKSSSAGVGIEGPPTPNYDQCFAYNKASRNAIDLSGILSLNENDFGIPNGSTIKYSTFDYSSVYDSGFRYVIRYGKNSKTPSIYTINGISTITLDLSDKPGNLAFSGYGNLTGTWSEIVYRPYGTNNPDYYNTIQTLLLPGACKCSGILGRGQGITEDTRTPYYMILSGGVTIGTAKAVKTTN